MAESWRLDSMDGRWWLVFPPPILGGTGQPTRLARAIRAYHEELLNAIAGEPIWPVTEHQEGMLFARYRPYYLRLAELMMPGVDPRSLTWQSRHRFFIATDPVTHPLTGGTVRGLSGLEQLLGMRYRAVAVADEGSADTGAGDIDLNALTVALLMFPKADVLGLARVMSPQDLDAVTTFADRIIKKAQNTEQGSAPRIMDAAVPCDRDDDARFTQARAQVLAWLEEMSVAVPPGF